MLTQKQIKEFQEEILDWFGKNKRDLPWRQSRDPYSILISEVMLQQTQVPRVIPKFIAWIERFPTLESLSKASVKEVLLYWSGLGYNRRALYLKRLAEEVVKNNNGVFSRSEKELLRLPGIGEYTAGALLCFAFDKQVAVIDTNIKKVIAVRFFNGKVPDKSTLKKIAEQLLPQGRAYEWNQALMDYASQELKTETVLRQGSGTARKIPFKSSKRFYRGQIIKLLLKQPETIESLFEKVENNGITKKEFREILLTLQKEKLIKKKEKIYSIA